MFNVPSPLRIGVYGADKADAGRGVGLWPAGYRGAITAAGATPVLLEANSGSESWDDVLRGIQGVVVRGFPHPGTEKHGDAESLCLWCKRKKFPLLAIDDGLLAMNAAFGGGNYLDLSREMPEALQHRHPPEPGLRHAIMVHPDTFTAQIYGEGEIVVNSAHRQGIMKPANGFSVGATALDGVIEALEGIGPWFAVGVQWQPASGSASGLDIQLFRALINAAQNPVQKTAKKRLAMAG